MVFHDWPFKTMSQFRHVNTSFLKIGSERRLLDPNCPQKKQNPPRKPQNTQNFDAALTIPPPKFTTVFRFFKRGGVAQLVRATES
jgi:hypothetical protein